MYKNLVKYLYITGIWWFLEEIGDGATEKLAADDWPLIQPSEMQIIIPPVHTAESVLTPLGMHCLLNFSNGILCDSILL